MLAIDIGEDVDRLREELAVARARVAELERSESAARSELRRLHQAQGQDPVTSQRLVDSALDGITLTSLAGEIVYANAAFKAMSGFGDRAVGSALADFYHPPQFAYLSTEVVPRLLEQGRWTGVLQIRRPDGSEWLGQTSAFVLTGPDGEATGMAAFFRDMTTQIRAEQERVAQVQMIEAQRVALRELGTPLIPIADEVIAMPLIGAIDSARAQQILEVLLQEISARGAAVVILDITGVKVVDAQVAAALVRAARAARLIGAEVVLTGISPGVARSLVELGAELHGIVTCGTFQSGIAHAMGRTGRAMIAGPRRGR